MPLAQAHLAQAGLPSVRSAPVKLPNLLDRWGNPVNHSGGGEPEPVIWWLEGAITAANCLAAYTPIVAASLAASYDNNAAPGNGLADGTYDCSLGVAPGFVAGTGWTLDGATQFLETGLPGATKPFTAIARVNCTDIADRRTLLGPGLTFNNTLLWEINPLQTQWLMWADSAVIGASATVVPLTVTYTMAVSYSGVGAFQFYLNGAPDGNGVNNMNFTAGLLAIGTHRGLMRFWLGSVQALSFYDDVLTDAQVLAVSTAAAAL